MQLNQTLEMFPQRSQAGTPQKAALGKVFQKWWCGAVFQSWRCYPVSTAKVLQFPTQDDREWVELYISAYARDKINRQEMMSWVAGILDTCGVTKLNLDGYRVRKAGSITTRKGTFPVVLIEATRTTTETICPVCGSCLGRYIAGEAPRITMWCRDCGSIYEAMVGQEGG